MSTNLINNYIDTKSQPAIAANSPAQKNSAQLKKPSNPRGHLIKPSLIDIPVDTYKSIAYDLKSLKNGLKGDSNDHQLGKINDLGMKLGGLAVAAFLFTQKQTPKTKWMEFVGFGSFFASMALWPKIALQAPARLIHGFDVQQKYEDSMGRKKSFFSDPQYLPWDLYSDKEINKIGNRLGVDRDIPNRREFIQEKMKKIAIQNNSMWMLTAGFATPIMGALICSQVEKKLGAMQSANKNTKLEAYLNNFENEVKKVDFSAFDKDYEAFIAKNGNKAMTKKLCLELADLMGPTLNPIAKEALAKDLTKKFVTKKEKYILDEEVVNKLLNDITTDLKNQWRDEPNELFDQNIPKKEAVIKMLSDKSYFKNELNSDTTEKAMKTITEMIEENMRVNNVDDRIQELFTTNLVNDHGDDAKVKRTNFLKNIVNELNELKKPIQEFAKGQIVFKHYSYNKLANAPETVAANLWNEITPGLVKVLDITPEEIQQAKIDRLQTKKLLRTKFEILATDENKYKSVISEIATIIKKLDSTIKSAEVENYCEKTDKFYNKSAAPAKVSGLEEFSKQLTAWHRGKKEIEDVLHNLNYGDEGGKAWARSRCEHLGLDEQGFRNLANKWESAKTAEEFEELFNSVKFFNENEINAIKKIKKDFAREKVPGLKSTFYRLIDTLDLFRRVATNTFGPHLHNGMKQEIIEEMLETAIDTFLSGHAGDYAVKLYTRRNPTPDKAPGLPEVVNGKIINKFYGKKDRMIDFYGDGVGVPYKTVDIPYDTSFFGKVMHFMYNTDPDQATKDALGTDIANAIKEYNKEFREKVVNADYPFKMNHKISGYNPGANASEKFRLVGLAVDEMFTKLFNQKFNTNKWMKMFGTTAIVLTGVTVGSQFLFGNLPNPKKIKKDTK